MPKINLCFQGWLTGANVDTVTVTATGAKLDVSERDPEEVSSRLNSGEWGVVLGDHLYDADDAEIEVFDFTGEV